MDRYKVLTKSRGSGLPGRAFKRIMKQYEDATQGGSIDANHTNDKGDYTDDDNSELLKYQQQEPDKTADFLGGVWKKTDYSQYPDKNGWGFYDNPYQKLVLRLGLNKAPTVLSDKEFNDYINQTGERVMYRGWSSSDSADRFTDADYTHTGAGRYGDGIYFTPDLSTARAYSGGGTGSVTKMALSPVARVISYSDLQAKMSAVTSSSPKFGRSLQLAGTQGQRNYYDSNVGEAQMALKLGYNVVDMGGGYLYALTRDAFVVSRKRP